MPYAARSCLVCASEYQPSYGAQRACGRDCGRKLHPAYGKATRACVVCGTDYRYTYSAQRTCSRGCGAKINGSYANRVRINWPRSKISYGDCPTCLRVFVRRGRQTFCSALCRAVKRLDERRATRNWGNASTTPPDKPCERCQRVVMHHPRRLCDPCVAESRREQKRRGKRRRRARRAGVASEPYSLSEIARRDRCRCGLCGRRVDMAKTVPHPEAPTVDHVIPLSRNGDDTRANVQLAHFRCNVIKGNREPPQQLALLG